MPVKTWTNAELDNLILQTEWPIECAGFETANLLQQLVSAIKSLRQPATRDAVEGMREALEEIVRRNQEREFIGETARDGETVDGWITRDGQYARIARAALPASDGSAT